MDTILDGHMSVFIYSFIYDEVIFGLAVNSMLFLQKKIFLYFGWQINGFCNFFQFSSSFYVCCQIELSFRLFCYIKFHT